MIRYNRLIFIYIVFRSIQMLPSKVFVFSTRLLIPARSTRIALTCLMSIEIHYTYIYYTYIYGKSFRIPQNICVYV